MEKTRKGPGRPKTIRKQDRKTHCITIRVTETQYRHIKYLRKIKRFSFPDYMRDAIDVAYEMYGRASKRKPKKDDAAL